MLGDPVDDLVLRECSPAVGLTLPHTMRFRCRPHGPGDGLPLVHPLQRIEKPPVPECRALRRYAYVSIQTHSQQIARFDTRKP
jgi:hypothetical protein